MAELCLQHKPKDDYVLLSFSDCDEVQAGAGRGAPREVKDQALESHKFGVLSQGTEKTTCCMASPPERGLSEETPCRSEWEAGHRAGNRPALQPRSWARLSSFELRVLHL